MVNMPAPLRPGDRIAVTAPSAGVPAALLPRLDFALGYLRAAGYDVVVGDCLEGAGVVSAPARERATELTAMLTDPGIAAVVPPWGGELAVEVLDHLEWAAIAAAEPTWLVGYSDVSTLLLALTTVSGTASVHGPNLMETPNGVPAPMATWLDVTTTTRGTPITQASSALHQAGGVDDWAVHPSSTDTALDVSGGWRLLDAGAGPVRVSGRLIGGCLETVSVLAGTAYGDVPAFAARHAPEGLIVYVEASEHGPFDVARDLWRLRLCGWFDAATAVLIGRTGAQDLSGFTQREAVASVMGDLDVPVALDVDCGHVRPQMALVNGALADLVIDGDTQELTQHL